MERKVDNNPGGDARIKEEDFDNRPFQYYEQTIHSRAMHFYLSDIVEEPKQYTEMIHRIKMASPNDVIYIVLNTGGGRLDTGIQIINAMRSSQAKVVAVLEAEAHSLGTLIFLAAHEFVVHDNCLMMFHNFSGGAAGKGNEMYAQVDATVKWFAKLARDVYYPFMTHDEIDRLLKGEDMWMDSDEIRVRLDHMVKQLDKAHRKQVRDEKQLSKLTIAPPAIIEEPKQKPKKKKVTKK